MPRNGSPRGRATIDICHLDRLSLCERRREVAQKECFDYMYDAIRSKTPVHVPAKQEQSMFLLVYIWEVFELGKPQKR